MTELATDRDARLVAALLAVVGSHGRSALGDPIALRAALLAGAVRCAPALPESGEVERLSCDFGSWAMVLAEYDTVGRLRGARELAQFWLTDGTG